MSERGFTTNIQWKGTDVCMDFNCPECKGYSHIDGFFANYIRCLHCKAVYQMPTDLPVERVSFAPQAPLEGEP